MKLANWFPYKIGLDGKEFAYFIVILVWAGYNVVTRPMWKWTPVWAGSMAPRSCADCSKESRAGETLNWFNLTKFNFLGWWIQARLFIVCRLLPLPTIKWCLIWSHSPSIVSHLYFEYILADLKLIPHGSSLDGEAKNSGKMNP